MIFQNAGVALRLEDSKPGVKLLADARRSTYCYPQRGGLAVWWRLRLPGFATALCLLDRRTKAARAPFRLGLDP